MPKSSHFCRYFLATMVYLVVVGGKEQFKKHMFLPIVDSRE